MKTAIVMMIVMAMGSISQANVTLNCTNKETLKRTQLEFTELVLDGVGYEDFIAGRAVVGNVEDNLMTAIKGRGVCQTGPVTLTCGASKYNLDLVLIGTKEEASVWTMKASAFQQGGYWSLAPLLDAKNHCNVSPRTK